MLCNIESHQKSALNSVCTFSSCNQSRLACSECLNQFHNDHLQYCCDIQFFLNKQKDFLDNKIRECIITQHLLNDMIQISTQQDKLNYLKNQIEYYFLEKKFIVQYDIIEIQVQQENQKSAVIESIVQIPQQQEIQIRSSDFIIQKSFIIKNNQEQVQQQIKENLQENNNFMIQQSKIKGIQRITQDSMIIKKQSVIKQNQSEIQEADLFQQGKLVQYIGQRLFLNQQFKEALNIFDNILKINPKSEVTWIHKILAESEQKQYQIAFQSCEQANSIIINSLDLIFLHGLVLEDAQLYEQALQQFERAIQLSSSNGLQQQNQLIESLQHAGQICIQQQQYDNAIQYFKRILEIQSREDIEYLIGNSNFYKGQILIHQQNYLDALNYFSISQKKESIFNYAFCLKEIQNYPSALREIEKFSQIDPNDVEGQLLKGQILYYLNKFEQAMKLFADVIELFPQFEEPINQFLIWAGGIKK